MRVVELYDRLRAEFETSPTQQPDIEAVRQLLSQGADPNNELARNHFCQQVPIHYAAQHNHTQAAEVLLNEGQADPNLLTDARNTALHLAAEQGHEIMTALLLRNKADPTLRTVSNWTALHWAACRGRRKVVELLLQAAAPVDALTELVETPLHLACANGHEETAVRLLNAGAELRALTGGGMLPYDLACRAGHTSLANTLFELQGSDWQPGMVVPRPGGRDGATSPERMGRLSPTRLGNLSPERGARGSGHLSPERMGRLSPAPMIHGGASFATPGWTPTAGEAAMEAEVEAAEASLERRDPAAAFLACHAMLDETRMSELLRKRLYAVLFASGQFMIEQRAAGKWHEAVLISKLEKDVGDAVDKQSGLEDLLHAREEEILELQAKVKLVGSGPDDATREKIKTLETQLAAAQHDLQESVSTGATVARDADMAKAAAAEEKQTLEERLKSSDDKAMKASAEAAGLRETVTRQEGELSQWRQKLATAKARMQELSEFYWTKSGSGAIKKKLKDMGDDASRWTKPQQLERCMAPDLALLEGDV